MSFFQKKEPCLYCGMETIENGVCSYCGKSARTPPTPPKSKTQKKNKTNKAVSILLFGFFSGLLIAWFVFFYFFWLSFSTKTGRIPELGEEGAVFFAAIAFLLSLFSAKNNKRAFLSTIILMMTSVLLIYKPIIAPRTYCWKDHCHVLSYTSETHLFFLVPGFLLSFFTLFFLLRFIKRLLKPNHQQEI